MKSSVGIGISVGVLAGIWTQVSLELALVTGASRGWLSEVLAANIRDAVDRPGAGTLRSAPKTA